LLIGHEKLSIQKKNSAFKDANEIIFNAYLHAFSLREALLLHKWAKEFARLTLFRLGWLRMGLKANITDGRHRLQSTQILLHKFLVGTQVCLYFYVENLCL